METLWGVDRWEGDQTMWSHAWRNTKEQTEAAQKKGQTECQNRDKTRLCSINTVKVKYPKLGFAELTYLIVQIAST